MKNVSTLKIHIVTSESSDFCKMAISKRITVSVIKHNTIFICNSKQISSLRLHLQRSTCSCQGVVFLKL